ncbi:transporter substrate-binding domain-containing protein [Chitinibacter bivalviorum]|uniref:Transporter substrate-binding domain-containing protein n=1 Tax=Chitinibacter bivalviorum TaxID=2739434 RepID=A0A7H9BJL7_9NEIS|nr:transporter substrate-binding domain-containing protein [Chitinibacter bivalviorum]QLG88438.1 transporter substrate-binding domain-containing protein [Chitinibacter bivalviorum]
MKLAFAVIALFSASVASAQEVLRMAIDEAWNPPQIMKQMGKPAGGLFFDLMTQIAINAGASPQWHLLSRKRLLNTLNANDIDLICHTNPKWLSNQYSPERWSSLFIKQENVVIAPPGRTRAAINFDSPDLLNLNIGTILGFNYPRLNNALARNSIRRIDSGSQDILLKHTHSGLLPLAVANRINVDYFNQSQDKKNRIEIIQTLDIQDTYCLISSSPNIPAQKIKDAISQLHTSGQLTQILARYQLQK